MERKKEKKEKRKKEKKKKDFKKGFTALLFLFIITYRWGQYSH